MPLIHKGTQNKGYRIFNIGEFLVFSSLYGKYFSL
jgi:hypothetical protein